MLGGAYVTFKGRGELVPSKPRVITKSEGILCSTAAESVQRW